MTVHGEKTAKDSMLKFFSTCLCTGFLAVAVTVFPHPAAAQSSALPDDQIQNRIQYLERQVQTLSRAVYRGEKPPASAADFSAAGDTHSMAQIEVRLSYLEEQIQTLTGRLEEYGYSIRTLQSRLDMLEDQAKNRPVIAPPSHIPAQVPHDGGTAPAYGQERYLPPQNSADSRPPLVSPPAQPILTIPQQGGAPEVLDTMPPAQPSVQPPAQAPAQALGVLTVTDGQKPAAPQDTPEKAYEGAFAQIRDHKYPEAAAAFKQFLLQYPDHNLAANAQYWLSETYYVRGEFTEAARQFARGYQTYPKSSKTADNLLKLGLSLAQSGKKDEACLSFKQLQQEFSGKADELIKRSHSEEKRLGCPQ